MNLQDRITGGVTAVTGFEKGSGKTTFLNYALPLVRKAGPVAVFSIGVDGVVKPRNTTAPQPEIHVEAGDLVLTTDAFARAATARFETSAIRIGTQSAVRTPTVAPGTSVRSASPSPMRPRHSWGPEASSPSRRRHFG